jgi:hypothetical protein
MAVVIPAEAGIQYAAASRFQSQLLWNTGSSAFADLVGDLMGEVDAAEGENHLGRQLLIALEAAARDRVADRLFDLALRGDADLLEKSAQTGVENVFVHEKLLDVYGWSGWFSMYSPRSR